MLNNEAKQNTPMKTTLCNDNATDAQRLDQAWTWLCKTRKAAPVNADIWDLRYRWPTHREMLLNQIQSSTYRLSPMRVVGQHRRVMWSAEDALVLKWVTLAIADALPLHERCEHVKGHGGGKTSIARLEQTLHENGYRWVCRTDIKGYYGAINKETLLSQLNEHLTRPAYLNVLTQYIHYSVEDGGIFYTPEQGIARGCALSPLMGALHLWTVDNHFARQKKSHYVRYMDDFVILTQTRWQLRKQVKQLNQYLATLGFQQHPDKTFIGRMSKGFDWLGAWFTDKGVTGIAPRALTNHQDKVRRLYEQTRHWPRTKQVRRVLDYATRWKIWAMAICLTPTIGHAAVSVTAIIEPGATASFQTSTTSVAKDNFPAVGNTNGDGYATGFGIRAATSTRPYYLCDGFFNPQTYSGTTSDGYHGISIGPDIVLGLRGNAISTGDKGAGLYAGVWSDRGVYSETGADRRANALWCAGVPATPEVIYRPTSTQSFSFSGHAFVHAGPLAPPGVYNTPALRLHRSDNYEGTHLVPLTEAGTITIKDSSCTVSFANPALDFGLRQQAKGVDVVLGFQQTQLDINCPYVASGTAAMSVSFSGTKGRWTNTLALVGTEGQGNVAEVRGVWGTGQGACTATDNPPIQYQGQQHSIGSVGEGLTAVPLTFTLCSNGSDLTGTGTAQATATLTWP